MPVPLDQQAVLHAEHKRAMELVAQEKQAAIALSESAAAKMHRADACTRALAEREEELRLLVEASEAQLAQREWEAARKEEQLLALEQEVRAATRQGDALLSREETLATRESALERAQEALVQGAQELDAKRAALREQAAILQAERQTMQDCRQGANLEMHERQANQALAEAQLSEAQQCWEAERKWQAAQDREHREMVALELHAAQEELARVKVDTTRSLADREAAEEQLQVLSKRIDEVQLSLEQLTSAKEAALKEAHDAQQAAQDALTFTNEKFASVQAECDCLVGEVQKLTAERNNVLDQIGQARLEWEQEQKAGMEALLEQQQSLRMQEERSRDESALMLAQLDERTREVQEWSAAEESKLARRRTQVENNEARLQALAPELQAREKEINSLREKVRAELDAARQLAATAAADRAQLDLREKEVGLRERDTQDLLSKAQTEGHRKMKEREALLTEWQQRLECQQNDLLAVQNELQLVQQRSSMENELRGRELEVATRELQGRIRSHDATESQATKDRQQREIGLNALESQLKLQQAALDKLEQELQEQQRRLEVEHKGLALSRQEASRLHSEARQAHSEAEEARAEAAALVARAESRDKRSKEAWEAAEAAGRAASAQQAQLQATLTSAKEKEAASIERDRAAQQASAAAAATSTQQAQEAARLKQLADMASEMQASAQKSSEAAAKDRKAAEAARKVLSSIEASLEAREAKLLDGWHNLQQQTVALRSLASQASAAGGPRRTTASSSSSGSSGSGSGYAQMSRHGYGGAGASLGPGPSQRPRVPVVDQEATARELQEIDDLLAPPSPSLLAPSTSGAAWKIPTVTLLDSSTDPETAAVALERRRNALMEREGNVQQWAVSVQAAMARAQAFMQHAQQLQAEGRDLVERWSQDTSVSATQRAELEALSRDLVAEQQQLVKVAAECQERGQLVEAEDRRLKALSAELAAQRQADADASAARKKAHDEAVAAHQRSVAEAAAAQQREAAALRVQAEQQQASADVAMAAVQQQRSMLDGQVGAFVYHNSHA